MRGPFTNEPVLDFQRREHRSRIEEALSRIRSTAGGEHAMVVGGDRVQCLKLLDGRPYTGGEVFTVTVQPIPYVTRSAHPDREPQLPKRKPPGVGLTEKSTPQKSVGPCPGRPPRTARSR